jgi:hypothetical protein
VWLVEPNYNEGFKSGRFRKIKLKRNKNSNKRYSLDWKSWIGVKDLIIWVSLIFCILAAMIYVRIPRDFYGRIYLEDNVTNIKELLKVTDKEAAKYNKKAELDHIYGRIEGEEAIRNRKPHIDVHYVQTIKGLGTTIEKEVSIYASLKDKEITSVYYDRDTDSYYYDDKFAYDRNKFDLEDIYDIVYKNVDMETVLKGYKPSIAFNMMGNRCSISVSYYKDKEDENKSPSKDVFTSIEVNLRTREITDIRTMN